MINREVIADCFREMGYHKIAKAIKKEKSKEVLKGYAKLVEIKAHKLNRFIVELSDLNKN